MRRSGTLAGVAAVIDKDLASSLLAGAVGAERLVISTAVPQVYLNYGQANQQALGAVQSEEMRRHIAAKQFPSGSMGPKVEAALDFLCRGGKEVVITDPDHLADALAGKAGTHIVP